MLDVSQPFYDGFMDQVIKRLGGSETCFWCICPSPGRAWCVDQRKIHHLL